MILHHDTHILLDSGWCAYRKSQHTIHRGHTETDGAWWVLVVNLNNVQLEAQNAWHISELRHFTPITSCRDLKSSVVLIRTPAPHHQRLVERWIADSLVDVLQAVFTPLHPDKVLGESKYFLSLLYQWSYWEEEFLKSPGLKQLQPFGYLDECKYIPTPNWCTKRALNLLVVNEY